jgi:hypothetical protein
MTTATFVVRFWREKTADNECWRGRIEHVQSGEDAAFCDIETMLGFMRRFGINLQESDDVTQTEI